MSVLPREVSSGRAGTHTRAIEAILCLTFLAAETLIISVGILPLDWIIRINTLFLLSLLIAAWRRFHGGMHICFLFLGTLLLFQAGSLIAFTLNPLFGNAPSLRDPFRFVLMRKIPFDVRRSVAELTMLSIIVSAVCIYLPCSLRYVPAASSSGPRSQMIRGLYRVYCATFPFLLYKDIRYFVFIRNHGGYLALFFMRDQILSSVGLFTRFLSLVASLAFIAIFVFERNRLRTYLITSTYLVGSVFDLLIGMRGKVFTLILTLWFLQNIKMGRRFDLFKIAAAGIVLAYVAMFAANFRENVDRQLLSPLSFISSQGISMQVTEAVIGYGHKFVRTPYMYLIHELENPIHTGVSQTNVPQGQSLDVDLTRYLSLRAASEGYGTGSSYLAESYLFGGLFGVASISLVIGCGFAWIHARSNTSAGILLLAFTMPSLIYLPRSELFDPLVEIARAIMAVVLSLPILAPAISIPKFSLMGKARDDRDWSAEDQPVPGGE